jgi:hypothetical protein
MHISALIDKCPSCEKTLDVHLFGMCSLLGPATTVCRWCGSEVNSGRSEWLLMPLALRMWYVTISVLYIGIVGFLGGYSSNIARSLWSHGTIEDKVPDFLGSEFLTAVVVWSGLALLIQVYRVFASILRGNATPRPSRGFWNLQTWLQLKLLILLFAVPIAAWIGRLAISR